MTDIAIEARNVWKSFVKGQPILKDVSLSIGDGEMVALIGASGSGKSTLIRTAAGLLTIDGANGDNSSAASGSIRILGSAMQQNGRVNREAKQLRSRIGIVFQQFNLVPRLPVLTNVCFGLLGQVPSWRGTLGLFSRNERQRAMRALQRVGIEQHALKRGSELSGGQQQRAAIARSLTQGSEILIADEPIASLDPSSARRVMDILADLNTNDGITVLVSLHQVEYALRYCPRTIALREGKVVYDGPSSALTPEFLGELYGAESEELFLPGLDGAAHQPATDIAAQFAVADTVPHRSPPAQVEPTGRARELTTASS
ncbi:MAG: phosphonate ABC transporter ATP-binding protein [Pseudomonadota bacterium]